MFSDYVHETKAKLGANVHTWKALFRHLLKPVVLGRQQLVPALHLKTTPVFDAPLGFPARSPVSAFSNLGVGDTVFVDLDKVPVRTKAALEPLLGRSDTIFCCPLPRGMSSAAGNGLMCACMPVGAHSGPAGAPRIKIAVRVVGYYKHTGSLVPSPARGAVVELPFHGQPPGGGPVTEHVWVPTVRCPSEPVPAHGPRKRANHDNHRFLQTVKAYFEEARQAKRARVSPRGEFSAATHF